MAFTEHYQEGLVWLSSDRIPVPHAFTTRFGGVSQGPFSSLNLSPWRGDDEACVRENYRRIFTALDLSPDRAVLSRQVHGEQVRPVTEADHGKGLDRPRDYEADGLMTDHPGTALVIFSADCAPILLFDPVRRAAAAVHAGWRGTVADIAGKAVARMADAYGSRPADLCAAIGPCIGPCCFEVGAEVWLAISALGAGFDTFSRPGPAPDKWMADLKGINRALLERAGVPADSIDVCPDCTRCSTEKYWSHRFTGDARGSQAAIISVKG